MSALEQQPVAWLCRWTTEGQDHHLVVWSHTIEDARQQARDHAAGPRTAVAARIATRHEAGST